MKKNEALKSLSCYIVEILLFPEYPNNLKDGFLLDFNIRKEIRNVIESRKITFKNFYDSLQKSCVEYCKEQLEYITIGIETERSKEYYERIIQLFKSGKIL